MDGSMLVITGDVSGSTKSGLATSRDLLANAIGRVAERFPETQANGAFQIIRGDGFQGAFASVTRGVRCAMFLHAFFRSVRTRTGSSPGVRMGLGIGPGTIEPGGVLASAGEAFVTSGRVLDSMKGAGDAVIRIRTPWEECDGVFDMECRLLDAILCGWTAGQARVLASALGDPDDALSQSEIARSLGIGQSQVSRQLARARFGTVRDFCGHAERVARLFEARREKGGDVR